MNQSDRDLGKRWFDRVWNHQDRSAVKEMLSPDAVIHDGENDTSGVADFYAFFDRMNATFSDIHVIIHDTVAEGDKLCLRWSCKAKHSGPGLGVPPTGKNVQVTGMSILRVANGMIAEGWQNWDMLGLMEQIRGGMKTATYIAP
jgi:steroid delta-isomerase-like uncharacterized protein